jgi:hypothetical protein
MGIMKRVTAVGQLLNNSPTINGRKGNEYEKQINFAA